MIISSDFIKIIYPYLHLLKSTILISMLKLSVHPGQRTLNTAIPCKEKILFGQDAKIIKTNSKNKIAYSVYDIKIKPDIYYQPHPAFVSDYAGYLYHDLGAKDVSNIFILNDFVKQATRELTAEDYVYQIKRLAHPAVQSPIFGLMSEHILGLKEYQKNLCILLK